MRNLVLIFLISAFILPAEGQKYTDPLIAGKINVKYLEFLVKNKIDSLRAKNRAKPLESDSLCYMAALNQANYMVSRNVLSHEQKNKEFKTLSHRFKFYGIPYLLAAENVMRTPYNTTVTLKNKKEIEATNYGSLSHLIFLSWFYSEGHKRNALNKALKITGLAIVLNEEKKELYACQVFANPTTNYVSVKPRNMFPEFNNLLELNRINLERSLLWNFIDNRQRILMFQI